MFYFFELRFACDACEFPCDNAGYKPDYDQQRRPADCRLAFFENTPFKESEPHSSEHQAESSHEHNVNARFSGKVRTRKWDLSKTDQTEFAHNQTHETERDNMPDDSDDDIFLECAQAARADYPVTGNLKDFPTLWEGTRRDSAMVAR